MNPFSTLLTGGALMLITITSNAQTKIKDGSVTGSSSLAQPGAILDLESNKRALLLPRVELTSTRSWLPLNGPTPTEGGYTVYNTSLTTEGDEFYPVLDEKVGEYYWNGEGWIAKKYTPNVYIEPFRVAQTTLPAYENIQNIYQNGKLGLGDFSTTQPIAKLDVRGPMRGGKPHPDELSGAGQVGKYSFAYGYDNRANGDYAIAMGLESVAMTGVALGIRAVSNGSSNPVAIGQNATATGESSLALGAYVTASGDRAVAIGSGSEANGHGSTAIGQGATSTGRFSSSIGFKTVTPSMYGVAMGFSNAFITGDPSEPDVLFQLGNGDANYLASPPAYRANAITVLRDGRTKIGGIHTTKPDLTLEISGTDGVLLPTGTNAERPATAAFGTLRYNTSIGRAEVYVNDVNGDGTQGDAGWKPL